MPTTTTTSAARPLPHAIDLRRSHLMIGHMAIAMSIAHERQEHERRIRHWAVIAHRQASERSIRRRIGRRVIRLGERLASAPLAEPAA